MHKDFRGKDLAVGDKVATTVSTYESLQLAYVHSFTPKMGGTLMFVEVAARNGWRGRSPASRSVAHSLSRSPGASADRPPSVRSVP